MLPEDIFGDVGKILDDDGLDLFVGGQLLWQRAAHQGDDGCDLGMGDAVVKGDGADGARGTGDQDLHCTRDVGVSLGRCWGCDGDSGLEIPRENRRDAFGAGYCVLGFQYYEYIIVWL